MRYWLKELRKDLNMSQLQVAQLSGIHRVHYTFIENGRRRPSPQVAQRIGKVLNFDWTLFFID
ncbi:helix-turn-helix transcriptional regulator [Xylocopilactobacillus apicola]|uniref:HTH-type transcriptional regulator YqaF n=1 Tax=Xylocopilactobacillus apicola TaxID=2932184 RepID=A0AAU9DQ17_9LACO|nr:helix-turn-helix transcriptional regulator [Xylocopilactobacillus apicola]BDR57934.1 putative HTH-type transcriptional regulator YqaF [Xylocopilactobacillus apicola]